MLLGAIERNLSTAGVLLVDPRLLRRVIVAHRALGGLGLQVPHTHCYGLTSEALRRLSVGLDLQLEAQHEEVVLLARQAPSQLDRARPARLLGQLWRTIFHVRVHLELERSTRSGMLTEPLVRRRIDHIGQIEFEEIRAALRHDDLVLPPYDEREQYIEFVALYLELKHFAPALLASTFPGLLDQARIDALIAEDLDAARLLERSCPEGAEAQSTVLLDAPGTMTGQASRPPQEARRMVSRRQAKRYARGADAARGEGNSVRALLLRTAAARAYPEGDPTRSQLTADARGDLRALGERLNAALNKPGGLDPEPARVQWDSILWMLADEASEGRFSVEARLLYDLQLAAVASEVEHSAVDLFTWARHLGKVPVVRPLPATRELRVARHLRDAGARVKDTRIDARDRKVLAKTMRWARERAERNVREALEPKLLAGLEEVGLRPHNLPERTARDKLMAELLDRAVEHGFVSFPDLRDAVARNQLKLEDMRDGRELLRGDALLALDGLLARSLDGVYRGGEVYLRGFHRGSSAFFGTRVGRSLFLYLILPALAALFVLKGVELVVVHPVAALLGVEAPAWLTPLAGHLPLESRLIAFGGAMVAALGLIHVSWLRGAAWFVLSALGVALLTIFVRVPRWVLRRQFVRQLLATRLVRATLRRVLLPAAVVGLLCWLTPLDALGSWAIPIVVVAFAGLCAAMTSRVGELSEELFFDWLAPRWRVFNHQLLPNALRLVVDLFRRLSDALERGMYRVDELLRFRRGQSRFVLVLKAAAGLVWFVIAYVVRLYFTLLVEPEINPVKHFPVATVAHKLSLPYLATLVEVSTALFSPLGPVVAGVLGAVTATLLPSAAGFLAWELKENWKLYRESRPDVLRPVTLGAHGETLAGLLVPGLHSGTLPKVYERLRRGAQREDERLRAQPKEPQGRRAEGYRGAFREAIEHVEGALRRCVEREIIALLTQSPGWPYGPLEVAGLDVGSNRIRVRVSCRRLGEAPIEITLEEQGGFVVASLTRLGWLSAIGPDEPEVRVRVENALVGFYQLAAVDLVREQLAAVLGREVPYDIDDGRLLMWRDDFHSEISFKLRGSFRRPLVRGKVRGRSPGEPPPVLDRRELIFQWDPVGWEEWIDAWDRKTGPLPHLLRGQPIIPWTNERPAIVEAQPRPALVEPAVEAPCTVRVPSEAEAMPDTSGVSPFAPTVRRGP